LFSEQGNKNTFYTLYAGIKLTLKIPIEPVLVANAYNPSYVGG
jgi:hypothetical protein